VVVGGEAGEPGSSIVAGSKVADYVDPEVAVT